MEMSWFALAPTIVIALVLAGAVLVRSGQSARANAKNGGGEAGHSTALPTVTANLRDAGNLLRSARKPVWPIDYRDFNARVQRGMKVAAGMAVVYAVVLAAQPGDNSLRGVLTLVGGLLLGAIFIAFGSIASVVHSLVLQILPWRGPITSTALGAAVGSAAAFLLRTGMERPNAAVIWSGVVYGLLTGIIDSWTSTRSGTESRSRQRSR